MLFGQIIRSIRDHWLWIPSWIILGMISIAMIATLPPGSGFIYPLRQIYFDLRQWLYLPLIIIVLITASQALPYMISARISRLDQEGRFMQHYIPRMRPFIVLLGVSIIGLSIISGDHIRPNALEQANFGEHRYYLILEEYRIQYDQYHLYECDRRGIVCEIIFTHLGSTDYSTIHLQLNDNRLDVLVDNAIVFTRP